MIRILHLYYDIMNLYGDNGNVRFLEKALKDQKQEVEITRKTLTDTLDDLDQYDIIYCGSSTERRRTACLKHLLPYKDLLKKAYESDKVFLFTGNSYEMMGKTIETPEGTLEGIGLFDFKTVEQAETRYTSDVIVTCEEIKEKSVGFINKCSKLLDNDHPLFRIVGKVGNTNSEQDGIHLRNFFGTQLIGPLLIKNPYFARYFIKTVFKLKGIPVYKDIEYPHMLKAYNTTMTELSKDI